MLNHSSLEHARRNIPPPTFLLQGMETLKDDTFPMGEPVSDVWQIVTRVMRRHMMVLPPQSLPGISCDATENKGLSCPHHMRAAVHHSPAGAWLRLLIHDFPPSIL